jgi:prepilin-type N-terminal cleavage/methylation domain-containing protein
MQARPGFTLVEMIAVIAVIAILAAAATPFRALVAKDPAERVADDISDILEFARRSSLRSGQSVEVTLLVREHSMTARQIGTVYPEFLAHRMLDMSGATLNAAAPVAMFTFSPIGSAFGDTITVRSAGQRFAITVRHVSGDVRIVKE